MAIGGGTARSNFVLPRLRTSEELESSLVLNDCPICDRPVYKVARQKKVLHEDTAYAMFGEEYAHYLCIRFLRLQRELILAADDDEEEGVDLPL